MACYMFVGIDAIYIKVKEKCLPEDSATCLSRNISEAFERVTKAAEESTKENYLSIMQAEISQSLKIAKGLLNELKFIRFELEIIQKKDLFMYLLCCQKLKMVDAFIKL